MAFGKTEAVMTNVQFKAIEQASRSAILSTEGYDGQTHYGDVLKALTPALFILVAAATLMLAIL
ncbi:MAG: hypothetical protein ACOH2L_13105 [Devosia sp.]